ncbi:uncharacterized protein V1516DRAFT_677257 [Lipomyces oligophaga]|uniref:uncharacterized protein n=1 Tax=Lipomyces oligophaga TaxID=45792 RepID=UPI0034CFC16E
MSSLKRQLPSSDGPSKRVHFGASSSGEPVPDHKDDDELLEQDIPGGTRRPARRNRLKNVDAYKSDSSEDEFFSVSRAKRKAGVSEEDDDQDMFADEPPRENTHLHDSDNDNDMGSSSDEDIDGVSKRSRKVRFLDVSQIEGQELPSSGIYQDDDQQIDTERVNREVEAFASHHRTTDAKGKRQELESDIAIPNIDNLDDEEDIDPEIGPAGSHKHAPILDPFNMINDVSEDPNEAFDASGTYIVPTPAAVAAASQEALHDAWLADVSSSSQIKATAKAEAARQEREKEADSRARSDEHQRPISVHLDSLIRLLEPAETPLEALARLAPQKQRNRSRRNRKLQAADKTQLDPAALENEKNRKQLVEQISDAADKLLNRGFNDIYDISREQVMRLYSRHAGRPWSS